MRYFLALLFCLCTCSWVNAQSLGVYFAGDSVDVDSSIVYAQDLYLEDGFDIDYHPADSAYYSDWVGGKWASKTYFERVAIFKKYNGSEWGVRIYVFTAIRDSQGKYRQYITPSSRAAYHFDVFSKVLYQHPERNIQKL